MKVDLSRAFPVPAVAQKKGSRRTYDVNITLNENGLRAMKVRFSFLNEAKKAAENYSYVEVSSPTYNKDYLFFRFFSERQHRKTYKLLKKGGKNGAATFSITPSKEESRAYRKNWVGKTYSMFYDEESGLHYISPLISRGVPESEFEFLN